MSFSKVPIMSFCRACCLEGESESWYKGVISLHVTDPLKTGATCLSFVYRSYFTHVGSISSFPKSQHRRNARHSLPSTFDFPERREKPSFKPRSWSSSSAAGNSRPSTPSASRSCPQSHRTPILHASLVPFVSSTCDRRPRIQLFGRSGTKLRLR